MVGGDGLRVQVRGGCSLRGFAVLPHAHRPLALSLMVWAACSTEAPVGTRGVGAPVGLSLPEPVG